MDDAVAFSNGGKSVEARMRVGVDMHSVSGIQQGIRTHLLEIYSRAVLLAPEIDFFLLGPNRKSLVQFSSAYRASNVHPVALAKTNPLRRLLWQLPRMEREFSLDWLHTQYIIPVLNSAMVAVTIHDILFEMYPAYFTWFFRLRSRILMRHAAQRANLVFTVSHFSKRALVDRYKVKAHDVLATPNAADRLRFYPGIDGHSFIEGRGLSAKNYLLSVGRLEPRKNYGVLLKAYARLCDPPPLVIVGQRDFRFLEVFSLIEGLGLSTKVTILDDVDTAELAALYRHCTLFVYPSVAEGFGMPVMEAFASCVPVITTDSTALTEIATGAALLAAPDDVDALEQAMRRLLGDPELRTFLAEAGLRRAHAYSWDTSARTLVDAFRRRGQASQQFSTSA